MSADSLRTVTTDDGPITYDSDMPIGALRQMTAAQGGDLGALIGAFSQVVTSWPYDGEPGDPASWDLLRTSQFSRVTEAIATDLGTLGEA